MQIFRFANAKSFLRMASYQKKSVFLQQSVDLSKLPDETLSNLGLLGRAIDVFPVGACLSFLMSAGKISEQYDRSKMSENGIVAPILEPDYPGDECNLSESVGVFVIPGEEENNP